MDVTFIETNKCIDELLEKCASTTARGWIAAKKEDRAELEALGVKLGEYNEQTGDFENCEMTLEVLEKLDEHWGRWIWGLE